MIYRIGEFTGMSVIALLIGVVARSQTRLSSVEGWPRVTSKDLEAELEKVARGQFDFSRHYHLLRPGSALPLALQHANDGPPAGRWPSEMP
jgi:hypothetical protein